MSSLRTRDAGIDAASPSSRAGVALAIMLSAQLMIILDATVVNIALPHIQASLRFSPTSLSWVMNAYTLTFGGLLLLGGRQATSWADGACSWPASACSPSPH